MLEVASLPKPVFAFAVISEAMRGALELDAPIARLARRLSWGVGIALAEPEWLFHWGANPGFRALFVGSRARGAGAVVVTNSEGGMDLAARVMRDAFGDLALLGFPMLYPPDRSAAASSASGCPR